MRWVHSASPATSGLCGADKNVAGPGGRPASPGAVAHVVAIEFRPKERRRGFLGGPLLRVGVVKTLPTSPHPRRLTAIKDKKLMGL